MELKLKRPIIFFDLETTGTNITLDRIVELSLIKVYPDGHEEVKSRRLNPEMHIPEESTAIHGITDDDVRDCPTFRQVSESLLKIFEGCDIAGFNSNKFDVPMLIEEFGRAGKVFSVADRSFIDVQNIYHKLEPRTLVAAYRYYCGKELEDAHSALADTRATYEVLKQQLDKYDELENDVEMLADFSRQKKNLDLAARIVLNDKNIPIFNFGKHKGVPVEEVYHKEPAFFDWMLQRDFSRNTKDVLIQLRARIRAKDDEARRARAAAKLNAANREKK